MNAREFNLLEEPWVRVLRPDCTVAEVSLAEALLNALVHRDYSFSGSIIINVNDARIEFISLGGLMPGLSLEDIHSGISQPRNHNLADSFPAGGKKRRINFHAFPVHLITAVRNAFFRKTGRYGIIVNKFSRK